MVKPNKQNVVQLLVTDAGLVIVTTDGTKHNMDRLAGPVTAESLPSRVALVNKLVKGDANVQFVYEEEADQFDAEVKWGNKRVTPITEWHEWV